MYGHPKKPDPYAKPQPIHPYEDDDEDNAAVALVCLAITTPLLFIAFAAGYMSGVFGWL